MWALLLLIIILTILICVHATNMYDLSRTQTWELTRHKNNVPLLDPPDEIIIPENALSCHKTLTPCISDADCQLCKESRARCWQFTTHVVFQFDEEGETVIQPNEKFCIALGAVGRRCNPHTGMWITRLVDEANVAIICHCLTPGLVTQLNIYEDCDLPVGCRPNGALININTTPLMCTCNEGFVPELSGTNTPFCRPLAIRDIILNPEFYPRPPCPVGYVESEHPAVSRVYRNQIGANVCLPDPCATDPITSERHNGGQLLFVPNGGADGGPLAMCVCNIHLNVYPVFSLHSMVVQQYTATDREITNACIRPLIADRRSVRSDLKIFWGRNSLKADADIVFQINEEQVQPSYRVLLAPRTTPHPRVANLATNFVLKWSLTSAYTAHSVNHSVRDIFQDYWNFNYLRRWEFTCPVAGIGRCRETRICRPTTLMCEWRLCMETGVQFRDDRCFLTLSPRVFPQVGEVNQICVWNTANYYPRDSFPVTFYINARFATDHGTTADIGIPHTFQTIFFTNSSETVAANQFDTLATILDTFPLYSSV
ncbi:pif-1 [Hyphantria cunea granulovirus]|uniref:Pif-1 n=1 Tax=Hyphantria cunea granulovirus TaxID=307448 RepID=A0AAF1D247_9BBAC|nr:pif-1 [Hyphantria cunea granulovirus]QBQ01557.1 pif-1 [Hyphantria cunea granulovirus]